MSDTPRTDAVEVLVGDDLVKFIGMVEADFARQLERELNAAQATIRQQQLLDEEIMRLRDHVKRLEEAGGALFDNSYPTIWDTPKTSAQKLVDQSRWVEAKEAKP